ncbi:MAG: aldehyde:ferredoxin oxidoreductase [Clostridiales bacterium]|nr:aldehyde:ferredoxin oxidoreductase [Clostridiales bacterium]
MQNKSYVRVMTVNLGSKEIKVEKRDDLKAYLGGVGVGVKLLQEHMRADKPPLDEAQPIVLSIGAATTIFPVITKTAALFISPLTGELGESYGGGRLAFAMLHCGIDALVIKGKAEKPVYIAMDAYNVEFKDARAIWRMDCDRTGQFIRDMNPGGGKRSIIRIGPAGENLCSYAMVSVDTYRHFGRLGLGAVFGSKNLKAIHIAGNISMRSQKFGQYFKVYREVFDKVCKTEVMAKYHDAGTSINIDPLNKAGALPTRNLQQTSFEHGGEISGESFADNNLVRKIACVGCPVGCIHIGQFRREFSAGYEYEAVTVGYDYELLFALGSFLGLGKREQILELIEQVEGEGLDAMSAGVCLGWATEAFERGLIGEEETIVPLRFGEVKGYLNAIGCIARRVNEFYRVLGDGVKAAAERYGGQEFAMQIAGNEMPGYHTGYGSLVGALVGARHSHLDNGGYSLDQGKNAEGLLPEEMADKLFREELERCLLNTLVICLFSRKVYDREAVRKLLACVDREYSDEELNGIAARIYRIKLQIKKSLGFDARQVKLPGRFFATPSMNGLLREDMARQVRDLFLERNEKVLQ